MYIKSAFSFRGRYFTLRLLILEWTFSFTVARFFQTNFIDSLFRTDMGARVARMTRNFNLENRAFREISKEKPRAAPRHESKGAPLVEVSDGELACYLHCSPGAQSWWTQCEKLWKKLVFSSSFCFHHVRVDPPEERPFARSSQIRVRGVDGHHNSINGRNRSNGSRGQSGDTGNN